MTKTPVSLPIEAVRDDLVQLLRDGSRVVLVAPPGAGKTTRVPLMLLGEPWTAGGRLIILEPRRLAARAAAERMAASLGEKVGETVGLRARFDTRVSARTRIEVVTEGVFTRMILDDPALDGIAAVIFDEYHERSLDADLGLALALDVQGALRDDLRLLVMSATLDGARVSAILDDAPLLVSEGRAFPVATRYLGRDPSRDIMNDVVAAVLRALREEEGSVIAFLPGQREITRAAGLLAERVASTIDIAPLFGAMDRAAQDRAVQPASPGRRKVVLATSIAETSLTIEGVRVVVDSGLTRAPRFEPDMGLTRLETVRVSRAAADQRRGRAGRTEPGVCYRLWEEAGNGALQAFARPEILDADLSGLLLDLVVWGVREPAQLRWLDPPPAPAVTAARTMLQDLGALTVEGAPTAMGRDIASLALPPRLARMVTVAAGRGVAQRGAEVAVLLIERALGGTGTDAEDRLTRWRQDRSGRADSARILARSLARAAARFGDGTGGDHEDLSAGHLLALAFPERIAKARGAPGTFLLVNGRAASVEAADRLAREPFLAVGELVGRAAATRILLAAPLTLEEIEAVAGDAIERIDETRFDKERAGLTRREQRRLRALVLTERILPLEAGPETTGLLARGVADLGLDRLPWTKDLQQWRDRVSFLRGAEGDPWPDLSDATLAVSIETWLAPYLAGRTRVAEIDASVLDQAIKSLLPYDMGRRLAQEAPTHFEAPTGSRLAVDYRGEGGPGIAVRVQELFGLSTHPALAGGRVPLVLHLLSPASRPIQITRDLPGFWRGSWAAVKADMKGRYPRHPWPDDPAAALPTTRTKPRGT
ncbi:ATP-dependent helicase HrpB [Lichenifustis flavocetrariae]|uniref:ATP-dependent helicase HrpB n=1 Tax=Lichenifustis flavocetrariae TaxID=2949735 RepID=A0AA42CPF6_9HYPH|nr:ATP-dependent helicase HrpB [Lichenifustis flavocetrariae]MCW6510340.1 ATP-dependent helicase HrpB [Lichenifustis flavocetrariae]